MTLAAFARLLDASPKWVLNTLRALDLEPNYTLELAKHLTIARAAHEDVGMPLPDAFDLAQRALTRWDGGTTGVTMDQATDHTCILTLDLYRLLSSFNVRLADLRSSYAPMVRGRPRSRKVNALDAADAWGLDLSLIRDNLQKSAEARLRQLDSMASFAGRVKRTNVERAAVERGVNV